MRTGSLDGSQTSVGAQLRQILLGRQENALGVVVRLGKAQHIPQIEDGGDRNGTGDRDNGDDHQHLRQRIAQRALFGMGQSFDQTFPHIGRVLSKLYFSILYGVDFSGKRGKMPTWL